MQIDSTDSQLLELYSHDETGGLEPVLPFGVAQPTTLAEVQAVVLEARRLSKVLTPRGAGTGKAGGCVPSENSIVVDFSKMNQILEISRENLTARLQPGVILADFKAAVEAQGLFYPPDPNSMIGCTVGGNVATNAAGP
ncbi:MAG: FAD-binding oxidoreductase, partial [Myxococcota bacterium]